MAREKVCRGQVSGNENALTKFEIQRLDELGLCGGSKVWNYIGRVRPSSRGP